MAPIEMKSEEDGGEWDHQGWIPPENAFLLADGSGTDGLKPEIVLYSYPHSINCMKVMMALHLKNIPYTTVMVNINLGDQFHDDFLKLNPKAEVPVLRNRRNGKLYLDSDSIIEKVNEFFPFHHHPKHTELRPPQGRTYTHEEFLKKFKSARMETLTNGSVMFDEKSLGIKPNYPFDNAAVRKQIREMVKYRLSVLISEATRLQPSNAAASAALQKKAIPFQQEIPFMTNRAKYEEVIAEIELLLDDCEAQLRRIGFLLWFLDSRITQVDISFSIFLYRLWQLGFAERFWTPRKRRFIYYYFEKVREIPSFRMVATMQESRLERWPFVVGAVVCLCAMTYESLFGQ